jgi:hypothetical protein
MTRGSSTVVEHSNPHPKVKGSSPAIASVPGRKGHSYVASSCSIAVGHSPPSPIVDGLSPTPLQFTGE